MTKGNDILKIPGQTRDRKRQKNNGNSGNRVRLIIELEPYTVQWSEASMVVKYVAQTDLN